MKKLDYASLVLGVASLLWILAMSGHWAVAAQPRITLTTAPALSQVIPVQDLVQMQLTVQDEQGQPLPAQAKISVQAPARNPWLTSDFPWVEGTSLLNLSAPLENGTLAWSQVMPIRGQYHLTVQLSPTQANAFEPFQQELTVTVPENPVKYRNALLLVGMLLTTGGLGGWIIGRGSLASAAAGLPQPVQQLLLWGVVLAAAVLLILNISAERASSHPDHGGVQSDTAGLTTQSQRPSLHAELQGRTFAFVGQPAEQAVVVEPRADQSLPSDLRVSVEAVDLESGQPVFTYSGPLSQPKVAWGWQFFDAAPHQVRATVSSASSGIETIQLGHTVEVQGKEPPLSTRFITLGYWLTIFAGAMGAGYRLALRPSAKPAR